MVWSILGVIFLLVGTGHAVAPQEYDLSLVFSDLPAETYTGTVRMNFVQIEDGKASINILAKENYIKFSRVDVLLIESDYVSIEIVRLEQKGDNMTIVVGRPLRKDYNYRLEIRFVGTTGPLGVIFDREIVYSNFSRETAHAGFPCFNEVSKINLELTHSLSWRGYSYSRGKRSERDGYAKTRFFTSTPILPSSLSFVLVRDYKEFNSTSSEIIKFLAPNDKSTQISKYLQQCASFLPPFRGMMSNDDDYEMTIVSIPGLTMDYVSNLNIIYVKTSLVRDDLEMTTDDHADFCLNILKLIGEQFFGIRLPSTNTVLNNAIPYYLSVKAFSDLKFWGGPFITEKVAEVFDLGFKNESILSDESGVKGAAFLGMLDEWIQICEPQLSIVNFINSYFNARVNTTPSFSDDLYEFLAENGQQCNISKLFPRESWDLWMKEPKITLLTASLTSDRKVKVECSNDVSDRVIPLVYKLEYEPTENITFITCKSSLVISNSNFTKGRILFNPSGSGLYRVQYQDLLWNSLMKKGGLKGIQIPARSRLISDGLELTLPHSENKGSVPYNTLLDITNYLTNEYSCTPWKIALKKLYVLRNAFFSDAQTTVILRQRVLMMMEYFTHFLGLGKSSFIHNVCRKTIFQANVIFRAGNLTSNLIQTFYKVYWNVYDLKNLGGDAWTTARCAMLTQNGALDEWWEKFENMYSEHHNSFEKRRLSEEYSCSIAPKRVLSKIIQMNSYDLSKYFEHFTSVAENVGPTLNFMTTLKKPNLPSETMKKMLEIIGPRINNRDKKSSSYLVTIAKNYPELQGTVNAALDQMKAMKEFTDKNLATFGLWLSSPLDPPRVPSWSPYEALPDSPSSKAPRANGLVDQMAQALATRLVQKSPKDLAQYIRKLSEQP